MSHETWFEDLGSHTRGLPQFTEFPSIGSPGEEPPSTTEDITAMSDDELSYNYQLVAKWQSFADWAVGRYAAAEIAAQQQLAHTKNRVYIELKEEKGKFQNAKEADILVDSHPDVVEASDRYSAIRQAHKLHLSTASAFGKLAMTYGNERKDRREREAREAMARHFD